MSSQDLIAQFIAKNGVTKCPATGSHSSNARSLRSLRDERERELSDVGECEEGIDAERASELERETFGRARSAGFSVSDALDESRARVNQ